MCSPGTHMPLRLHARANTTQTPSQPRRTIPPQLLTQPTAPQFRCGLLSLTPQNGVGAWGLASHTGAKRVPLGNARRPDGM
jgi:hypothetical protein